VNASGQPVELSPDGPLSDAAWAKHRLSRLILSPELDQCCDLGGHVEDGVVDAAAAGVWLVVSRV
jgi:hypothetical protein